ncbi:MAG: ankyrin repeat domain-containing protein [Halobacteriovoraceae bacterium]|nr:ankyrin repeat domain-containing protein [Halobacteriovoraceae bacterium]
MTKNTDEQNIVVVFTEDKELQEKVKETFPDYKIIISNVMLSTFETFKNHYVKAVVFETYQTDPFCGINETDLDILMYYACSDDSKHKATAFIPIDKKPVEGEDKNFNFANDFYGRLYDKYLYLKPGTFFDEIDPESIEMPEGMELLGNLVDVLSDATKGLDEKVTITGGDSQVGEESQRISGSPEDNEDTAQVVSGSTEEEEAVEVVSGSAEEEESEQSFDQEYTDDESQIIGGDLEEDEEVQTISGSSEGNEETTTVSGSFDEDDDEEFSVSGESVDLADKTVQTIKGEKEDLAEDDFMKVKSLKPQEEEEEEPQSADINGRNSKGQTPVMVFAKKGDTEKVRSLLNSGAKHNLMCKQGLSLLHYACWGSDDVEFIDELILKYNLKHSKRDSENKDCLFYAVIGNNANIVEYLLNNGARIATKYSGIPLLHVAAKVNATNSFKSLLLFEPNLKATDDFGEDIIKYCKTKKKLNFLKIIAAVSKLKQKAAS